ncbi:hypothetical protein [Streptomyces sp. NPDC018352]|uniref:hypothetical protein n=1 Tax=Streptomyces sp. NPDC018352 TaxID=3157194 RepID=UPI0033FE1F1A
MLLEERGHARGDAFSRSRENNSGIYIGLHHLGFLSRCAARRKHYAAQGQS